MKRFPFFVVAVLLLLSPIATNAASGWSLLNSAEMFNDWIENQVEIMQEDSADLQLQGGEELLPLRGSGSVMTEGPRQTQYVEFVAEGQTVVFADVPSGEWFAPFVRDAAERGIVSGYRDTNGKFTGKYGPVNSVTLEELAKMSFLAAGLSRVSCPMIPSNPLAKGRWSEIYVSCAEHEGFAVYADGTVDILRPATRAEVTMTVLQAFGAGMRDSPPAGVKLKDVSDSTLFANAIYTAIQDRVVSGDTDASGNPTGIFRPGDAVNRAEISKIMSAAMQVYGGGD